MAGDPTRVVLWDRHERPRVLPVAWSVGGALHGGVSYGVDSWGEAFSTLRRHRLRFGPIKTLQLWGHGYRNGPAISGDVLVTGDRPAHVGRHTFDDLAAAAGPGQDIVMFRSCQMAQNQYAMRVASMAFACPVAAHTRVTNAPNPLTQRGFVIVEPGELATYPDDYDGSTLFTLAMNFDRRTARGRRNYAKGRRWVSQYPQAQVP